MWTNINTNDDLIIIPDDNNKEDISSNDFESDLGSNKTKNWNFLNNNASSRKTNIEDINSAKKISTDNLDLNLDLSENKESSSKASMDFSDLWNNTLNNSSYISEKENSQMDAWIGLNLSSKQKNPTEFDSNLDDTLSMNTVEDAYFSSWDYDEFTNSIWDMNSIIDETIWKLNSREKVNSSSKQKNLDKISSLKSRIKDLEEEVRVHEEKVNVLDAENRQIKANVKKLDTMKMSDSDKTTSTKPIKDHN